MVFILSLPHILDVFLKHFEEFKELFIIPLDLFISELCFLESAAKIIFSIYIGLVWFNMIVSLFLLWILSVCWYLSRSITICLELFDNYFWKPFKDVILLFIDFKPIFNDSFLLLFLFYFSWLWVFFPNVANSVIKCPLINNEL